MRRVLATLALLLALPVMAAPRVHIPPASALHRHRVEQAVARAWGVNGSPALLAAQLHQESGWKPA
ncbi:lytic transglycosylase, partial [Lysobacteraceae bacterium NML75-0749]